VGAARGDLQVAVHGVVKAEVGGAQLVGGLEGGEDGALAVGGPHIVAGQGVGLKGVSGLAADADAAADLGTAAGVHLGELDDVHLSCEVEAALGVFHTKVSSILIKVSLEGEFQAIGHASEGGLDLVATGLEELFWVGLVGCRVG